MGIRDDRSDKDTAPAAAHQPQLSAPAIRVQAKLTVGAHDDPYEREADRVAAEVISRLSATPSLAQPPQVARRADPTNSVGPEGGALDTDTEARIQSMRGGGRPLETNTRAQLETAMGADFGSVRIHEGGEATTLSRSLGAAAFTVGSDVFFQGPVPTGDTGTHLLAHELTHTLQQGASVRRAPDADQARQHAETQVARETMRAMVTLVGTHLQQSTATLQLIQAQGPMAMVEPGMSGPIMSHAASLQGLLVGLTPIQAQLVSSWAKVKPTLTGPADGVLVPQVDRAIDDISKKLLVWQALAAAINPATCVGLAAQMSGEILPAHSALLSSTATVLGGNATGGKAAVKNPPAAPPAAAKGPSTGPRAKIQIGSQRARG